jgi:hypothetical protein
LHSITAALVFRSTLQTVEELNPPTCGGPSKHRNHFAPSHRVESFSGISTEFGISAHSAKSMEAQSMQSSTGCAEEARGNGLAITVEPGLRSRLTLTRPWPATRARSASAARPGAAGASASQPWVAGRPRT